MGLTRPGDRISRAYTHYWVSFTFIWMVLAL